MVDPTHMTQIQTTGSSNCQAWWTGYAFSIYADL